MLNDTLPGFQGTSTGLAESENLTSAVAVQVDDQTRRLPGIAKTPGGSGRPPTGPAGAR